MLRRASKITHFIQHFDEYDQYNQLACHPSKYSNHYSLVVQLNLAEQGQAYHQRKLQLSLELQRNLLELKIHKDTILCRILHLNLIYFQKILKKKTYQLD